MLAFHHFLHPSHDAVDYNARFYACAYNACGYISVSSPTVNANLQEDICLSQ